MARRTGEAPARLRGAIEAHQRADEDRDRQASMLKVEEEQERRSRRGWSPTHEPAGPSPSSLPPSEPQAHTRTTTAWTSHRSLSRRGTEERERRETDERLSVSRRGVETGRGAECRGDGAEC